MRVREWQQHVYASEQHTHHLQHATLLNQPSILVYTRKRTCMCCLRINVCMWGRVSPAEIQCARLQPIARHCLCTHVFHTLRRAVHCHMQLRNSFRTPCIRFFKKKKRRKYIIYYLLYFDRNTLRFRLHAVVSIQPPHA